MTALLIISKEECRPQRYIRPSLASLPAITLYGNEAGFFPESSGRALNVFLASYRSGSCIASGLAGTARATVLTLSWRDLISVPVERNLFAGAGVHTCAHRLQLPRTSLYYFCTAVKIVTCSASSIAQPTCAKARNHQQMLESKFKAVLAMLIRARPSSSFAVLSLTNMSK